MLYPGFCGPSGKSQSPIANCERTINWYLEAIQSPFAPTDLALYPTPGSQNFLSTPDNVGRGELAVEGRAFAVIGTGFYEVFSDQSYTKRGTVVQNTNPATISYNGKTGDQLLITSGSNAYLFDLSSNTFSTIAALAGKATMGGMLNARFLVFDSATGTVYFSALNDGSTFTTGTDFFKRSQAPDPWQSMLVAPPEIWLIGEHTGEVWYDSGAFPQPFAPIQGAFFEYGTPAPFSVAKAGGYITWLSKTKDGIGPIVAARGYTPQRISSFAVDTAIAQFVREGAVSDCEQLAYEDSGHVFACFSFPTAKATWCSDLSQGFVWHERGKWSSANHRYEVWGPRAHMFAFNKHLVVERGSGSINEIDVTIGSEADGSVIRRLRIPPPLWAKSMRERLVVDALRIIAEPGLGLVSGQGSDPRLMMRASTDAKVWSSERMASAGKLGEYSRRCIFRRCGSSETLWVPEITVTDAIPWRLSAAEIEGSGFQTRQAA